jgi:hypothetical protein
LRSVGRQIFSDTWIALLAEFRDLARVRFSLRVSQQALLRDPLTVRKDEVPADLLSRLTGKPPQSPAPLHLSDALSAGQIHLPTRF